MLSDESWFKSPDDRQPPRRVPAARRVRPVGQGADGIFVDQDVHCRPLVPMTRPRSRRTRSATRTSDRSAGRRSSSDSTPAAGSDRIGVEFNYYNKKTVDAILDKVVAPVVGPVGHAADQHRRASSTKASSCRSARRRSASRTINLDLGGQFSTNDNDGDGTRYSGSVLRRRRTASLAPSNRLSGVQLGSRSASSRPTSTARRVQRRT